MTHTCLHVWRVPARALPRLPWRLAVDARRLRREPGTRFVKLLGTGRDSRFGAGSVELTRWAAITVTDRPVSFPGWDRLAVAGCRVELRPLASRGRWAGVEPFPPPGAPSGDRPRGTSQPEDGPPGDSQPEDRPRGSGQPEDRPRGSSQPEERPRGDSPRWDGPVLALTRARLRPSRALTFWKAIGAAAAPLADAPGRWASFGVGEAPLGWQGTVSLWRDGADLVDFAYRQPGHRRAIERTPTVGWYAEELFARFAVLGVTGDAGVLGLAGDAPPGAWTGGDSG